MCNTDEYRAMYQEMKKIEPDETFRLIANAKSKEEQDFFAMIGDFFFTTQTKGIGQKEGVLGGNGRRFARCVVKQT